MKISKRKKCHLALSRPYVKCKPKSVTKEDLEKAVKKIMAKVSQLATVLAAIAANVTEAKTQIDETQTQVTEIATTAGKIVIEIQTLKDSVGDADVTPELQTSVDNLVALGESLKSSAAAARQAAASAKTSVQAADDLNPDATPTPPVEPS